jgi:hypothetical protein
VEENDGKQLFVCHVVLTDSNYRLAKPPPLRKESNVPEARDSGRKSVYGILIFSRHVLCGIVQLTGIDDHLLLIRVHYR